MTFRVALLGIYHESNTFIDVPTTMADFENSHLLVGDEIRCEYQHAHHEIGGMLEVMDSEEIEVVPVLFAEATPGGIISADTYDSLRVGLFGKLGKIGPIDGCLVVVHGAAVSEKVRDMDGNWLGKLREIVGPDIPIVGTLDLHANVSQQMVNATDALVSYKQNPHLDQRDRGKDAAQLLVRMLKHGVEVVQHLIQLPIAISIEQQFTQNEPCKSLFEYAHRLNEEEHVLAVSITLGFPYADVVEMGTSVLVVAEGSKDIATDVARKLGRYIWQNRQKYVGQKSSAERVLANLKKLNTPVLLLDMGDNIGGGAPGNGLNLVRKLEQEGSCKYFCYLYDPAAVSFVEEKGQGEFLPLILKGFDEEGPAQLKINVRLSNVGDGVFYEDVPRHGGQVRYDMGRLAIVQTEGGGVLMLSTLRVPPFSLKQLTSFGLDPKDFDVIIAKGVNAPVAAYSPVCNSIVQVDTPGVTQADITRFTYQNRRYPLFPFETEISVVPDFLTGGNIKYLSFYTEGPVVDRYGNLFFTDLKGRSIFRIDRAGVIEKWSEALCPNGQAIDINGFHLICDSEEGVVAKFDANGKFVSNLVKRFCADQQVYVPNDVVADKNGGVYFTDSVRHNGKVFYIAADGKQTILVDNLDYPNGLVFSPSEDRLYVAESYANRILCLTQDRLTQQWKKEVFVDLPFHFSGKAESNLPDGIALDSCGRLWVAHYGMGALQVLDSSGDLIATLTTGFPLVSNVCFLAEENSLFVTGGFAEPGPGAILRIDLDVVNQYIDDSDKTEYN